jgi:hypothetical protein
VRLSTRSAQPVGRPGCGLLAGHDRHELAAAEQHAAQQLGADLLEVRAR